MSIFIVAEIGINHNGDMPTCKELIDVALEIGCDAVKFQKRDIDKVYTQEFLDSPRESPWGVTQREQKFGLEFNIDEYREIDQYCKENDILLSNAANFSQFKLQMEFRKFVAQSQRKRFFCISL